MKLAFYILLIFPFLSFSQNNKSLNVETEYLKLVNTQNNKELIADNYRNAELVADSIVFCKSTDKNVSAFFIELAKSYSLNNDYANEVFSILRQQFLFSDDTKNLLAKNLFFDACFKLNITKQKAQEIYKLKENISNDYANNFLLFLKASILINNKKLNDKILKYNSFYKTISKNYPFWLHQWEFFTTIKIKNKRILNLISFDKDNTNKKLIEFMPEKEQKYVLLKAEKYYRKSKALNQAKYYLQEYKTHDLSFFEKIRAINRKILIITPII